jgi:hypothetical protein
MIPDLEDEIHAVEQRIARERAGLGAFAEECGERMRDAIASPPVLATAVVAGFVLADLVGRRRREARGRKPGAAGLVAGAAWSLLRLRYGPPLELARRLWGRIADSASTGVSPARAQAGGAPPATRRPGPL